MIKVISAIIMVSLTALTCCIKVQHNLQRHSKEIHFFIFNLKKSRLSNCLSSNGTKPQIFGSRKNSDLVPW